MSTYSQDAQRLVMVAKQSVAADTILPATPIPDVGDVVIVPASADLSQAYTPAAGDSFKILMNTGKSPDGVIGATGALHLVSETIKPEMVVSAIAKGYSAPTAQVMTVDVGTAIPNNEYYITLDFDEYGSTSVQNTVQAYAVFVSTATSTADDIAAGLAANLNANLSRAGVQRATATAAGSVVTITGRIQSIINFNNPFNLIRFRVGLNDSFAADAAVAQTSAASKGFGYGPEVANIEHFAQGSEANWTWLDYPEMYPRDLYADPTANYDCVSLRLKTVNEGFGSNISSFRQIDIFGVDGTLADLITDLNTILGAGTITAP